MDAAGGNARNWHSAEPGPIRPGSEQHKGLFSRMLLDTFNPYKPAVIDWPALDAAARERLVSLPIWDIAVQTEGKASLRVKSYAATVADPLLRQAIELNGFEEARHKTVLANLVKAYGIKLAPEPDYLAPRDPEWALHGDRLQRVHRQLLRLRPVRAGEAVRLFPAGAGRHVRAGDAGGRPPHHLLRQLGRVAPAQPAVVAAAVVPGQDPRRLGLPDLGAHRHRARPRRRGAGQQLHRHRQQVGRRRHHARGADGHLPRRERPAARRLRSAPAAAALRAARWCGWRAASWADTNPRPSRRLSIPKLAGISL